MTLGPVDAGVGVVVLAVVAAAAWFAATVLVAHLGRDLDRAHRAVAVCVVAIAIVCAEAQALGSIGLYRLVPLVLASGTIALVAAKLGRPTGSIGARATRMRPSSAVELLAAMPVALVAFTWFGRALDSERSGIREFDSLWYHLPGAATFAQSGWVTRLRFSATDPLTAFYPANSELLHSLGMVALSRDFVSPLLSWGWLALLLVLAWAFMAGSAPAARMLGPAVVAAVISAPLIVTTQAGTAKNDIEGAVLVLAAIFLLTAVPRSAGQLALSGVAAGLAMSTRIALLAPVAGIAACALVLAPPVRRGRAFAVWLAGCATTGAFWYVRNWVRAGSPLPFAHLSFGPIELRHVANPVTDPYAFSVAHYLGHPSVLVNLVKATAPYSFGPLWMFLLGGAAIGLVAGLGRSDVVNRVLSIVGLATVAGYVLAPQTALGPEGSPTAPFFSQALRLLLPALLCGWLVLAREASRRWLAWRFAVAATALLLVATALPDTWPGPQRDGVVVLVAIGVGVAAIRRLRPARPRLAALSTAVLAAVLLIGLWAAQPTAASRYSSASSEQERVWSFFATTHSAHVAARQFDSFPLFGFDLSNRVDFVGERSDIGVAPPPDCDAWRQSLADGGYDYVVVGPDEFLQQAPPEVAWTRQIVRDPPIVRAGSLSVFAVSAPLAACRGAPIDAR